MNWTNCTTRFVIEAAVTVVGSGLGTTVVGFFFQRKLDRELEIQKAFLTRTSRVHERQIDALMKLYRDLDKAQGLFQRLTSGSRVAGEVSDDEYHRLLQCAVRSAQDTFSECHLLIPSLLAQQCDAFFATLFNGQLNLQCAEMVPGNERAELFQDARDTAFKQMPALLQQIENDARSLIHGEQVKNSV